MILYVECAGGGVGVVSIRLYRTCRLASAVECGHLPKGLPQRPTTLVRNVLHPWVILLLPLREVGPGLVWVSVSRADIARR